MPATACRRAYDHRMRDLVCEDRDPRLFRHLGVPRSTAVSWIRRGPRTVVSAEVLAMNGAQLRLAEVLALRRRIRFLLAIVRLAEAGKHLRAGSNTTSVVADSYERCTGCSPMSRSASRGDVTMAFVWTTRTTSGSTAVDGKGATAAAWAAPR